jgi:hypothetical protein
LNKDSQGTTTLLVAVQPCVDVAQYFAQTSAFEAQALGLLVVAG